MSETLGLKSINMLSKEQYENVEQPAHDELYVVSHSGMGFPSANYDDLELGASGTEYTAPANGWIAIAKNTASTNQYLNLRNDTKAYQVLSQPNINSGTISVILPVQKNDIFKVEYSASGVTHFFRFFYSEGE